MLIFSNGCITYNTVHRAQGYTPERVVVKEGDEVIKNDGVSFAIKRKDAKGENEEVRFIPDSPAQPSMGFAYKPNGAYYALLLLTIPADIVTSPIQLIGFLVIGGLFAGSSLQ